LEERCLWRNPRRYIYLTALLGNDEGLFFRAVMSAPARFLPTVYAPSVGQARLELGHTFRRRRGMYLSLRHKGRIEEVLCNWPVKDVRTLCATSGGRILGPGEGVPSQYLLPVHLDLRQPRISTEELDAFFDEFVDAVQRVFPGCCIDFEGWAGVDAVRLLERYRHRVCCYNGDIQGSAGVAVAGLFSTLRITGGKLRDQRILILGAGFAASGVADLIASAITLEGPTLSQARKRISLFDIDGLVEPSRTDLYGFQKPYAHPHPPTRAFLSAIESLKPTAIVGVSTKGKAFTREIIEAMARLNRRPIIFALSSPTDHAECTAEEAYRWSEGRALYAARVQFPEVRVGERVLVPSQANSRYVLPAVGLAIYATRAKRVTDEMFVAAARGVAEQVTQAELDAGLLYPPQSQILETKVKAAQRVAEIVFAHGLAGVGRPDNLRAFIQSQLYNPETPAAHRYQGQGERAGSAALRPRMN
jgi:malate dehydrogenase (oxaloacetate-decarboxylating)(NADP+)